MDNGRHASGFNFASAWRRTAHAGGGVLTSHNLSHNIVPTLSPMTARLGASPIEMASLKHG